MKVEYGGKILQRDYVVPSHLLLYMVGFLKNYFFTLITYLEIYSYHIFNPGELSSADLNDYKNVKVTQSNLYIANMLHSGVYLLFLEPNRKIMVKLLF